MEYYLKHNVRIKYFCTLNSADVSLLLSTISDSYAKMGNQDTAGLKEYLFLAFAEGSYLIPPGCYPCLALLTYTWEVLTLRGTQLT